MKKHRRKLKYRLNSIRWRIHRTWPWCKGRKYFYWPINRWVRQLPFHVYGWKLLSPGRKRAYILSWLQGLKYGFGWLRVQWCDDCQKMRAPVFEQVKLRELTYPEWVCGHCSHIFWKHSSYNCTRCGWSPSGSGADEDYDPVTNTWHKPKLMLHCSDTTERSSLDGTFLDWEEIWWCPCCKNVFSFMNGT